MTITLFYILISLVVSFLVSRGIYNPIARLVSRVSATWADQKGKQGIRVNNEYEFLGRVYSDVMDRNKDMEDMIKSMKPLIKEKLFTNIVLGNVTDIKEITEKLTMLDIDFNLPNFIVFIQQIDDFNIFCQKYSEIDRHILKMKLVNMVEGLFSSRCSGVCFESEPDKLVSVINFDGSDNSVQQQDNIPGLIENVKKAVDESFPFTVTVGIGRMYKDITKVKLSYDEALNALKYKLYQGKNEIINIDDVNLAEPQTEEIYYHYRSEKQLIIINNLRTGNYAEVEAHVNELFEEIKEDKKFSYDYIQMVFKRITDSIVELIISYGKTVKEVFGSKRDIYRELSEKETMEDIQVWLLDICRVITDTINQINMSKTNKNIENILEYIDNNLQRDISLRDIADWIGLSSGYVSTLFKEYIGKNFVDYLNGKRVERAKQLMKDTRLNIKEVGFRVGFNNIQTFMRTFKKYEGITPGQYRENCN